MPAWSYNYGKTLCGYCKKVSRIEAFKLSFYQQVLMASDICRHIQRGTKDLRQKIVSAIKVSNLREVRITSNRKNDYIYPNYGLNLSTIEIQSKCNKI